MSHGGGSSSSGQPSCAAVSLGKYLRRALRRRINGGKPRRKRPEVRSASGSGEVRVSTELMTSSSSSSLRPSEPVVRVVLQGGVVEAYGGVVLACTVIRNHPPGLCLAYPDVFRNPHGARVRPLQPLFPGQKFYLLPERTMERLQREIPECSVGAFDDDKARGDDASEDDVTSSTETTTTTTTSEEEEDTLDHSSGAASSEEETVAATAGDDDGDDCATRSWCCAREYFEAKERWEECQFKKMVARGLAVEQSAEPDRKEAAMKKKGKKNKKGRRKKKRNSAAVPSTWVQDVESAGDAEEDMGAQPAVGGGGELTSPASIRAHQLQRLIGACSKCHGFFGFIRYQLELSCTHSNRSD